MKATGEVMAIGQNFEEAILKAARGLEVGVKDLNLPAFEKEGDEKIRERVNQCTDQRIFAIYQALKRNLLSIDEIHNITKIDEWFLEKLVKIVQMEKELSNQSSKSKSNNNVVSKSSTTAPFNSTTSHCSSSTVFFNSNTVSLNLCLHKKIVYFLFIQGRKHCIS